jgi:hypothetical protein
VIDEDQNPDDGEYGLDHTEDTGGQEGGAGTADTDRGEYLEESLAYLFTDIISFIRTHSWGIVVDSVNSGSILPHEQHASKEQAPHDLAVPSGGLEGLPETFTNRSGLLLKNQVKRSDFFNDVKVVGGQIANPAKILDGLLAAVLGHEPAGALPDPEGSEEKHTGGNELNGEGDDPLSVVGRKSLLDSIVDPETDQSSGLPAEFVNTDKATSDGGG